jgi:hypothetical protein
MFAMTMQVAVSNEMRCGVEGKETALTSRTCKRAVTGVNHGPRTPIPRVALKELLLEALERRLRREGGILVQPGRGDHRVIEVRVETSIQRKSFVYKRSFVVPPGNWTEQLMAEDAILLVTRENGFS